MVTWDPLGNRRSLWYHVTPFSTSISLGCKYKSLNVTQTIPEIFDILCYYGRREAHRFSTSTRDFLFKVAAPEEIHHSREIARCEYRCSMEYYLYFLFKTVTQRDTAPLTTHYSISIGMEYYYQICENRKSTWIFQIILMLRILIRCPIRECFMMFLLGQTRDCGHDREGQCLEYSLCKVFVRDMLKSRACLFLLAIARERILSVFISSIG